MKRIKEILSTRIVLPFSVILYAATIYLSSCMGGVDSKEYGVAATEWDDYKSWYKATKEPNTGDPTGFLDSKHRGEQAYRDVFVNSIAESVMKGESAFPFPEGSIIVKEAFDDKEDYDAQKGPELTIMVKLADGVAPDTNNWLFIMGASGTVSGTGMDSKWGKFCGNCHINAMSKDFSFMAATTAN